MTQPRAKAVHYSEAPAEVADEEGAAGVTLRSLIDERADGAPNYVLGMIEIEPGGHTPQHAHAYEHENFVIEGQGRVLIGDQWHAVGPGSVVFVPAGAVHGYENSGDRPLRILNGTPTRRTMETQRAGRKA